MSQNGKFAPKVTPTTASKQGWKDFLEGKPYPKEYDSWPEIHQRHYERGRLRAAGAHLIYRSIPQNEPSDIVQRTNGLRLVPPGFKRRRVNPKRALRPSRHRFQNQ